MPDHQATDPDVWICERCEFSGPKDGFPTHPRQGYMTCPRCGDIPRRSDDYRKMTRAQLIDLLWVRRVKGWHYQTTKRGLINHLIRNDTAIVEREDENDGSCKTADLA